MAVYIRVIWTESVIMVGDLKVFVNINIANVFVQFMIVSCD